VGSRQGSDVVSPPVSSGLRNCVVRMPRALLTGTDTPEIAATQLQQARRASQPSEAYPFQHTLSEAHGTAGGLHEFVSTLSKDTPRHVTSHGRSQV
jgi:hypothetical protein